MAGIMGKDAYIKVCKKAEVLEKELDYEKARNKTLIKEVTADCETIKARDAKIDELKLEVEKWKSKLNRTVKMYEEEAYLVDQERKEESYKYDQAQDYIFELESIKDFFKNESHKMKESIKKYEKDREDSAMEISKLKSELAERDDEIEKYMNRIAYLEDEVEKQKTTINNRKRYYEQKDKELINKLYGTISSKIAENKELKDKLVESNEAGQLYFDWYNQARESNTKFMKDILNLKDEVRKLNAACQKKSVLANKHFKKYTELRRLLTIIENQFHLCVEEFPEFYLIHNSEKPFRINKDLLMNINMEDNHE